MLTLQVHEAEVARRLADRSGPPENAGRDADGRRRRQEGEGENDRPELEQDCCPFLDGLTLSERLLEELDALARQVAHAEAAAEVVRDALDEAAFRWSPTRSSAGSDAPAKRSEPTALESSPTS